MKRDPYTAWFRLMQSSLSMNQTGLRAMETLHAAGHVIAARGAIINAAMLSPLTADYQELSRMVPEKIDAFSRSGLATVSAWRTAQSRYLGHMQHLGAMAMRGRPPTSAEMVDLGERMSALALGAAEATTRLSADMLAPLHSGATANARRLSNRPGAATRAKAAA